MFLPGLSRSPRRSSQACRSSRSGSSLFHTVGNFHANSFNSPFSFGSPSSSFSSFFYFYPLSPFLVLFLLHLLLLPISSFCFLSPPTFLLLLLLFLLLMLLFYSIYAPLLPPFNPSSFPASLTFPLPPLYPSPPPFHYVHSMFLRARATRTQWVVQSCTARPSATPQARQSTATTCPKWTASSSWHWSPAPGRTQKLCRDRKKN